MRINQLLAASTDLSRRAADDAIQAGRVTINGEPAKLGQEVGEHDTVTLDAQPLQKRTMQYIALHKPSGYIVSRDAQGQGKSVYELLPEGLRHLQYVGRLDKDSTGLLVFTNDGPFANLLTHPSSEKVKRYEITLNKDLTDADGHQLLDGVDLEDGISRFASLSGDGKRWVLTITEGRNRQIRRSFDALGYTVRRLHRTGFGKLDLGDLAIGEVRSIKPGDIV